MEVVKGKKCFFLGTWFGISVSATGCKRILFSKQ
jgi:hypothetical protein